MRTLTMSRKRVLQRNELEEEDGERRGFHIGDYATVTTRSQRKRDGVQLIDPKRRPTFALFGFNRTSESDSLRMEMLNEIFPAIRITSASEQEAPPEQDTKSNPYHFQCDFKQTLVEGIDANAVVAMLDYFWLQSNWWAERYGENWLVADSSCKVFEIFEKIAKLQVFFVPLDSSCGFMFNCTNDADLTVLMVEKSLSLELIDWREANKVHPLCLATKRAYEERLDIDEQRSYFGQGRYVGAKLPKFVPKIKLDDIENDIANPYSFAVVYRRGLDWRKYITSLRG
jgi:hypothetical protein